MVEAEGGLIIRKETMIVKNLRPIDEIYTRETDVSRSEDLVYRNLTSQFYLATRQGLLW